jgi:hypothetical protein
MKNAILSCVLLLLACGAGPALAQGVEQPAVKDPPAATQAKAKVKITPVEPETLTGFVRTVDATNNLVVVQASEVPFDFKVTQVTKIKIGDHNATLTELAGLVNSQASVTFVPLKSGDVAQSIEVH